MNNRVPAFYPVMPVEFEQYLRIVNEIVVPKCIDGNEVSIENNSSALRPELARIGNTYFDIYSSKEDVWEDAYYLVWHSSEDRKNENLLIDLAIESIKSLEYWER